MREITTPDQPQGFQSPRLASSSLPPPKLRLALLQEGAQGLL